MDESERIRRETFEAANRLTDATEKISALSRRKHFERELRERGNWLAIGPAEPPEWVGKWSEHWDGLAKDQGYLALVEEARSARAALHSEEFERAIESLRLGAGGPAADWAIAYLEADPWYFRSGYLKSSLARWLRQVPLSESQARRIQLAILRAIQKGPREETEELAKLARRVEDTRFRTELEAVIKGSDSSSVVRSKRLLEKCRLNDNRTGNWGVR